MESEEWSTTPAQANIKTPQMIHIPAGPFLMGTSSDDIKRLQLKEKDWAYDWDDNNLFAAEQPQHVIKLPDYEIGQFPITNADYYTFTWDTCYRLPRGWVGFCFPAETNLHPVVGISKMDVEAYIKWLNEKTQGDYRLPTEAEWERAARGTDGRIYPWGNTFDPWRCNTGESGKKGTTQVGDYSPSGDSVCGAADMIGNVWEWTSSQYAPYPYRIDGSRDIRKPGARYVVRGGAWYYSRKLARCAAREGMQEHHQSPSLGFRLARNYHPQEDNSATNSG